MVESEQVSDFLSSIQCLSMSYPSRTLIAATDLGSNPLDLKLLDAWSTPATEQDFPTQLEAESEMDEKAESVEKKGQSEEKKMEVKVKEEEPMKEAGYNLRHTKINVDSDYEEEEEDYVGNGNGNEDNEEDVVINLVSSDSFVDSEEEEEESESNKVFSSLYQSRIRFVSSHTAPKKSAKRVIQRSILSGHVAKSCRFSPSSRAKIYENESRLSQLMNGFCAFSIFSRRFPTLSPCSRILQAKQIIVQAREQEAQGRLTESLKLYKEGDAAREDSWVAQEYLPENERLRKKVEEVEKQIEIIALVNGDGEQQQNEERVLQILNYAGLSGLLKLKTIGEAKAKRILKERESGLFVSVDVFFIAF